MAIAEQKAQLIEMLKDPSAQVQEAANQSLSALESGESLPDIIKRIGSGRRADQVEAVYALEKSPLEEANKLLSQLIAHPVIDIRTAALRVIQSRRDLRFLKQVAERLSDKDATAAALAAEVLGDLGDKRAEQILINTIRQAPDSVRASCLLSLGKLRSEKAPKLALNAAKSKSASIRHAAALVLGMVVDEE